MVFLSTQDDDGVSDVLAYVQVYGSQLRLAFSAGPGLDWGPLVSVDFMRLLPSGVVLTGGGDRVLLETEPLQAITMRQVGRNDRDLWARLPPLLERGHTER